MYSKCVLAECTEERGESSLDATLKEETLDETLSASEVRDKNKTFFGCIFVWFPCRYVSSPYANHVEYPLQAGGEVAGDEHVTLCSSSDHSDIVTLGNTRETELGPWDEQTVEEEEGAVSEELYLGTSSSSQYTFSAAETGRANQHTL